MVRVSNRFTFLRLAAQETTGLDLHFRPGMGENEGVAAVETGGKRQSTGLSHLIGSSPCFTK